jgi:hypothetical protein
MRREKWKKRRGNKLYSRRRHTRNLRIEQEEELNGEGSEIREIKMRTEG